MRFHHIALIVSDLQEALRLWRDVLGFELQVEKTIPDSEEPEPTGLMSARLLDDLWGVKNARSRMAWLRSAGGAMIELQQPDNPQVEKTAADKLDYAHTGIREVGLQVEDIEYWFDRVRTHGYRTTSDYIWMSGNFAKSFLFFDSDDNMIQLWQHISRAKREDNQGTR